jgi:hypothetical protein
MSPLPEQVLGTHHIKDRARIDGAFATRKLIRTRKFALIKPVMTSTLGRCVASTRCMPTAPRHLREPL